MIQKHLENFSEVKKIIVDAGYTGEPFSSKIRELIQADVEVVKRTELHKFVVLPKRWIVERTFGWLEKNRRLWKNCERNTNTSLQMVVLAMVALLVRRF